MKRREDWTAREDRILKEAASNEEMTLMAVARTLGRTYRATAHRMGKLGLKKTKFRNGCNSRATKSSFYPTTLDNLDEFLS